jgi:DNA-binding winged helix-turn-helix (wHTH) protein/Flp pilus assembly protein TadD
MPSAARIRFGIFELDVETGELWKRGRKLKLPPKPVRVLALLASSPGQLVTRENIRSELWGNDVFVDFEQGLNFSIRKIRAVLGDSVKKPRFIETLPRRGYRFIAGIDRDAPVDGSSPGQAPGSDGAQIQACELYTRARRSFTSAGKSGLEEARRDFEAALAFDPDYALAHSGLGATYALRNLNRRDPADLESAQTHLQRALELDAELAEPYPWLCYVYMRQNRIERALQCGHRGIQLQPNLVHAHYFLGLAYFAFCETDPTKYPEAAGHLLQAGKVAPAWQATWFVLSYLALVNGDYEKSAEFARRLLDGNRAAAGLPFIGAEIVLASVEMRRGQPDRARDTLLGFLERMSASDHMYRDSMAAIAACVLGDVEMRDDRPAEALAAYRKAWHDTQEYRRIAAYQRISSRAQAGLASAYAMLGERDRALELLAKARSLAEVSQLPMHAAAGSSLPELFVSIGAACTRAGQPEQALEMLEHAVLSGWMDAAWLECDPELEPLRCAPRFVALVDEIRRRPKLAWGAASFVNAE